MTVTFEFVNWARRLPSPMWVSLTQSGEGLNRTKSLSLPRDSQWPMALGRGSSSPAFTFKLKFRSSWVLSLPGFRLECNVISFPGSLACQLTLQILGCVSLQKCMSQFLRINLFMDVYTHPIGSVLKIPGHGVRRAGPRLPGSSGSGTVFAQ